MESNKKYVIGLDFGTDSCRALVVDTYTGREMATGVSFYPRWKAGLYCDAHNNRYRQHPLDYIESMIEAVHIALSDLKEEEIASICGLCFDTTGSTPALTDKAGMPLALCPAAQRLRKICSGIVLPVTNPVIQSQCSTQA